jgi:hypothetical protein
MSFQNLTLAYCRKVSGVILTPEEARKIIGSQPRTILRNMHRALQLMTWLNTQEDWLRLQACKMVLRGKA